VRKIAKKIFSLFWRFGISIILLFVLFKKIDFKSTFGVIANLDQPYFFLAIAVFFILDLFAFLRWKMLLDAQGARFPVRRVLGSFSGGLFFSLFLPSTIGGDVARTLDLGAHTKSRSVIAASVFLDRLSGFVGLVLVASVSLVFGYRLISEPSVYLVVFLLAAILAVLLLVIFNNGIYNWLNRSIHKKGLMDNIRKLHSEMYFFRSKPRVLALNILCSVIIQGGSSLFSYCVLRSLGARINVLYPLVFNPVITVITSLPVSIGGLGLRDMSSVFFYAKAGVSQNIALAQSILNFSVIVFFGLIRGIIYVAAFRHRRLQPHQANRRPE